MGDIVSAETGAPIPNASVYYMGTREGTTSNEEGSFMLRADLSHKRTLVVSAVGYRTERFPIEPGVMAGVQVELREQVSILNEVLVRPGENPALPLIAAVRARRNENDRTRLELPSSGPQHTQLFISDINRNHLQRRLWRSLRAGMICTGDSSLLLPLYDSRRGAVLMTETDYQALLTRDGDLNFYDNEISLMGRSFLSPLARAGNTYYNYYLADSLSSPLGKQYLIHFKTKNPFYETLNGSLWVDSATLALTAIEAEVPRQTNVNYLRGARISQRYAADRSLLSEQIHVVLDFAVKIDDSRMFPTVLIRHTIGGDSLMAQSPMPVVVPDSSQSVQSVPTISDSVLSASMDSLMQTPIVRVARWAAEIINTGYVPTGTPVDVGKVEELIHFNHTEGVHVGLPLRTNERLMRNVSLEAAVGYGFRNRHFTGMGRVSAIIPAPRRHLLMAEYHDKILGSDVSELSRMCYENSVGLRQMDLTASLIRSIYTNDRAYNTLIRHREFSIRSENDWTDNLETQFYLKIGNMGFNYQTLGGLVRLSWGERKVDRYMQRRYVHSRLPILFLQAELGSWTPEKSQSSQPGLHVYSQLGLMLRQHAGLGRAGTLDYVITTGCVFGRVPNLLLHQFEGNQSYAYDPYRFTLMNNGQYSARYYAQAHVEWNGQGVLFNLIPGIRYLRLRELITAKLAYGFNPSDTADASSVTYAEIGCGIGNILRVLDLYSVWRLTNRQEPGAPNWAIRFRFNIGL